MALYRGAKLRVLRHARDEALYILLPGPLRDIALQDPMIETDGQRPRFSTAREKVHMG